MTTSRPDTHDCRRLGYLTLDNTVACLACDRELDDQALEESR